MLTCPDYIDSADQEVLSFDYSNGALENRKVIATTPPPLAPATDAPGVFDGLCTDGVGNIWVARWSDGRVVGYTPEGKIICNINVPGARNVTIPCFGGKTLRSTTRG
jgi:sugar lactone lactonase YvrE